MTRSRRSIPDKVYHCEGALELWLNKLCKKMIDHGSRSTRAPDSGVESELCLVGLDLTKFITGKVHYNFYLINFC